MFQANRTGDAGAGSAPASDKLEPITGTHQGRRAARRRWARRGAGLLIRAAALTAVLAVKFESCDDEVECAPAPDVDNRILIAVCAVEYERTRDPAIGLEYAKARHRSGQYDAARAATTALLGTPVRADALLLLGRIAEKQKRYDEAQSFLGRALELHRAENQLSRVAEDEQALANVLADKEDYGGSLRMLDRCIADAHRSQARRIEAYCHLSAGRTLADVGFIEAARRELEVAEPLLDEDRDLAVLYAEQGDRHQDEGQHALAVQAFEAALPKAQRAGLATKQRSILENLVHALTELGRTEEAERHLREARAIDVADEDVAVRLHLEARIAHRRGDPRAAALLEQAYDAAEGDDDERIHIAALRARIALAAGDLESARSWARRGIDDVERIRQHQSAIQLRPWILSSRREPYELLFTALARLGRTEDALLVFDQWYGRTLLEALSSPADTGLADLQAAALHTEELGALLPALSSAPVMKNEDRQVVLDAVRSADLIALVVADREVWRISSVAGRMQMKSLGRGRALTHLFDVFIARPTDRNVADQLGELILPADLVRNTDEALRVVLDAPLAALPVVALRRGGRPLIAARPVIRAPRLSAVSCTAPLARPRQVLVLADSRGDLPAARQGAQRIAALFGATALVGDAATSEALFTAAPADLLHIATHAEPRTAGGVLVLHDRVVSALEIWKRGPAVDRVILAACGSGTTVDEGATTLATAFLARRARQVVATLRPVSDPGAEELTRLFYDSGGATDPIRALAAAQRALVETASSDWPHFATFGQDTCRTTP